LVDSKSDASYPEILDSEDTTILFFTDGEQILGSKILPKNLNIKYRSVKTINNDETTSLVWDQTLGPVVPVSSDPRPMV
jgi:hypothetical protein